VIFSKDKFINKITLHNIMKLIHSIKIDLFSKSDDPKEINDAFDFILPFDPVKEKVDITAKYYGKDEETDSGDPLTVYTVNIDKQSQITRTIEYLRRMLSPIQKRDIIDTTKKFMDEDCCMFIRLDKQSLLKKQFELVEHGDCFHIRINIAAYPKSVSKAKEIAEQILSG
jgi:RNA binding exosome subunit